MKLVNFASLDPQIRASGRTGLSGASLQDKALWSNLSQDWDKFAAEGADAYASLAQANGVKADSHLLEPMELAIEEGRTRSAIVQVRVNQARFRRSVLASYNATCCISGLQNERLVVASHIVPWSLDKKNRLNPQNGLCLSAIHDRAFDQGLITVMPDFTVRVSASLLKSETTNQLLRSLIETDRKEILRPERFAPHTTFLVWHAQNFGFM
ncbi:MAG: HNH endonuclease [Polynucleobacter sp.]|nr:HNH endonuclease [Polynucleobacter sp.]